jgi:hypothetical protein
MSAFFLFCRWLAKSRRNLRIAHVAGFGGVDNGFHASWVGFYSYSGNPCAANGIGNAVHYEALKKNRTLHPRPLVLHDCLIIFHRQVKYLDCSACAMIVRVDIITDL